MKKILSVTLALVLLLSVIPTGIFTFTASAATSGYYTYTVSNGTVHFLPRNLPIKLNNCKSD